MTVQELTKPELYNVWAERQKAQFRDKFSDETGYIKDELVIPFLHLTHIGGSTTPAIMGVSKWETAAQVYDKMTGAIDTSIPVHNFVFDRGHACEHFVAEQAAKVLHLRLDTGYTLYDQLRPWSMAQIDSFLWVGNDTVPCEIKCVSFNNATSDGKEWGNGCIINDNGTIVQEDDLIPVAYYIQCQKQLMVTNGQYMYLAAWLTFENHVRIYVINRDEEMIEAIKKAEDDFLFNYVIAGKRPAEVEIKDEPEIIKGKTMDVTERLQELLDDYHALEEEVNPKKKQLDGIKEHISELMGNAAILVDAEGKKLVTKTTVSTSRFNSTKLKNDDAELYAKYLTTTNSTRLTIKK